MSFFGFGKHRGRERERSDRDWGDHRTRDWGERRYSADDLLGRDARGGDYYGQAHRGANRFERPEEFGQNRGDYHNDWQASGRDYGDRGEHPSWNDRWQNSYGPRGGRGDSQSYRGSTNENYGEFYRGRDEGTHGAYWSPERTSFGDYGDEDHRNEYDGGARGGNMSSYNAGQFRGRGPKNYKRSDERIREDVCECLTEDERIDGTNIEVQVKDCEVTLSGSVNSREEKRRAEDLIDRLSGVRDIHNQLRVVNEGGLIEGSQSRQSNPEPQSGPGGQRH